MTCSAPPLFGTPSRGTPDAPFKARPVAPLLKWPGGKSGELTRILQAAPGKFGRYFEPFVGGGATYFAVEPHVPSFINDASVDLMNFYRLVQSQDGEFFEYLVQLDDWWKEIEGAVDLIGDRFVRMFLSSREGTAPSVEELRLGNLEVAAVQATVPAIWSFATSRFAQECRGIVPKKLARMRKIERDRRQQLPVEDVWSNLEGAFKAGCYTALRAAYNSGRATDDQSPRQAALFFFLREYAYAAMFRFNSRGEFNVPYGGMTYNRKNFRSKIEHLRTPEVVARLQNTQIECIDFEEFLAKHRPGPNDFMFLDPPYDSEFSDYDLNDFSRRDHIRLASLMADTTCKFVLVIKSTPAVLEIYDNSSWETLAFDKKYMWTIKERNDRSATHLMVTNDLDLVQLAS